MSASVLKGECQSLDFRPSFGLTSPPTAETAEPSAFSRSSCIFNDLALALLVLTGNVKTTWSLGTFGAMYRCVIVSLAALRMSDEERMYPKWLSWVSLFSGLFLAFWVEWYIWSIGFY